MNVEAEVKLAQKGNRDAFVHFIRYYQGSLYRVAKAILNLDEDCADAIQDTVLSAYQSIHKLRQPAYAKTWLIRILINQCYQILRKRKKIISIQEIRDIPAVSRESELIELKEEIEQLEEPLRMVIILHYFEDLPVKEIAGVLGIPEGTVKSRLHRARQALGDRWNSAERVISGE
ncbi:sigma-70 family RNA polymerase sigma factor [Paenactinomyces guangxiensis]|uniref:Sigma-70 family RNA polymerase sigma factor n=1 Tax=Paenactinomyces guangxiensis TaxID=1490290 RepID=A0A7W1WST3_9BACL|nr:sigma-70 family RNA polymerase sigma factor [Paenactinomyces guangxiensis]MBA4495314.1 sigma-70 family RNA polymerase sigma factor [Paenactinomyces guangxiensis]MBH8592564.1 sigma-70 family RNA polymerase sigma factor [Paenactinomyces guangxiensis]